MKLHNIGKYLLVVNAAAFLGSLLYMIFFEPPSGWVEVLLIVLLLVSYILLSLSFSFIFYHSAILKRKKASKAIVIISSSIFATGWFFKLMHWPGASIAIIISSLLFCFGGLPLLMKSRYEERRTLISEKTLALSIADMISIVLMVNGLLFKIMHWPGGIFLILFGATILIATFVLWSMSFRKEVKLRLLAEERLKETLKEIEEKHLIIETKNKEITDSITYARRIQEAILPPADFITTHVPESFIYYQPKDIVAGDFYWAEKAGGVFLIAVADCTGHGVPGALVSVVCSNALNRSVKEFGLSDPGQILGKTRELVLENFSKSRESIKDGMDISLLSMEKKAEGYTIKWAGANNPLWHISQAGTLRPAMGMPDGAALREIKADKQPIGFTDDARPFNTHVIDARQGDVFYLFTDGYADQFGGPKGKKFKYGQLEDVLLSIREMPMSTQKEAISQALQNWKGSLEQIDDICMIGIRL